MKRFGWVLVSISLLLGLLPLPAQAANLEVEAKSALLMDVATGTILFEQNSHEALAPASVTKVMTMLLIMEAIDSGKIGWGDSVTTSEAAAAKGGSQVFLKVGESMSVEDMVKSIAVSSANDCACAMAEHLCGSEAAFVEAMNARAKELGMNDTNFVNCTSLDDAEDAANHKTSAHDIALMSRELLKTTRISPSLPPSGWTASGTGNLVFPTPIRWFGFTAAAPASKPASPKGPDTAFPHRQNERAYS